MHQIKKGNQWPFGTKAHIAVDADSGLVHTVTTTAANETDVAQIADLLHGKEQQVWADSGYRGARTRVDREDLQWHIAARPSDIAKLPDGRRKAAAQKREHREASVRAKVEHPFRVIKRQFGLAKVRFRELAKNTAHVMTLFALSNLWMARRQLLAMAQVRPRQPAGGRPFDGGVKAQPLSHRGDPERNYDGRKPGRLRRLCPARTEAC